MKKQIQIKSQRKLILILISTLVGLSILGMLIGAFVDFQFSKLMVGNYDFTRTQGAKNLGFAWRFAMFPGVFSTVLFGFIICCLINFNPKYKSYNLRWKIVYLIFAYMFCFMLLLWQTYDGFIGQIYENYSIPNPNNGNGFWDLTKLLYAFIVALILIVIFTVLNVFVFSKCWANNVGTNVYKWSIFAFFAIILGCVVVQLMKLDIHRERFFQIMYTGNEENFKPWYSLIWNMNVADDDIGTSAMTSFPSGHTTWAMTLVTLIPFLIVIVNVSNNRKRLIVISSISSLIIAFVICTMFCRIATGNHYLSDVCGAVLIQLACYTFSYFLINKVGKLNTQIT